MEETARCRTGNRGNGGDLGGLWLRAGCARHIDLQNKSHSHRRSYPEDGEGTEKKKGCKPGPLEVWIMVF